MNLDVDFLIDFFRKHTPIKKNKPLDEQDAPAAAPEPAAAAPSSGGRHRRGHWQWRAASG